MPIDRLNARIVLHFTDQQTRGFMTENTSTSPQDFEAWANIYATHKAFSHPSELHGALCGRLSAGGRLSPDDWLALACEQMGVAPESADSSSELADFMISAYDLTLSQLQATDLTFSPLLPDDEYELDQRLQALSAWVRGFLEGMAVMASRELGEASGDIRELIEDLVAISQVSQGEADSEEGEQQYIEIMEYVRVGTMTVFTEFNPPPAPKNKTLH